MYAQIHVAIVVPVDVQQCRNAEFELVVAVEQVACCPGVTGRPARLMNH